MYTFANDYGAPEHVRFNYALDEHGLRAGAHQYMYVDPRFVIKFAWGDASRRGAMAARAASRTAAKAKAKARP